jgi:hypothetical protein
MNDAGEIYHCSVCHDPIFDLISDDGSILCDACYEAQLDEWETLDDFYRQAEEAYEAWSSNPEEYPA